METRKRLLEAAVRVFSEKGFHGASTRKIAMMAGVNPVTLFRNFTSKQQLYEAVLEHLFTTTNVFEKVAQASHQRMHPKKRIAAIIDIIIKAMHDNPPLYRVVLYSALEQHPEGLSLVWKRLDRIFAQISRYIEDGIDNGEYRRTNTDIVARIIVGSAVHHYQLAELYRGEKLSKLPKWDISESYAEIIYAALKPEKTRGGDDGTVQ